MIFVLASERRSLIRLNNVVCSDLPSGLKEHTVFQREDLLCGWLFPTAWCLITSLPARIFFLNHQQTVKRKTQISPHILFPLRLLATLFIDGCFKQK